MNAAITNTMADRIAELKETQTIDGGEVLPGFTCAVADFFSDLDFYQNPTA